MDEEKLKYQLENHDTLNFFKSARGKAVAFMIIIAICNYAMIQVGWLGPFIWLDIILILILAFFIYRGSRIALIITMTYWTISKILTLYESFQDPEFVAIGIAASVIFWVIGMHFFWDAYQIEKAKRKKEKDNEKDIPQFYCPKCGAKIKKGRSFCTQCGEKIR